MAVLQKLTSKFDWKRSLDLVSVIHLGILLILFLIFRDHLLVKHIGRVYAEPIFVTEAIKAAPLVFIAPFVLLILNYVPLRYNICYQKLTWSSMDETLRLRTFIMVLIVILSWAYSTYAYNYFLDQPHYLERLTVIVLGVATFFSPLFAGPFIVVVYTISGQLSTPDVIGNPITDRRIVFYVLAIFAIMVYVRPILRIKISAFITLVLCLMGASYFTPGISKLQLSQSNYLWPLSETLQNHFIGAYVNGWMSPLSSTTAVGVAKIISILRVPFLLFTLVLEVSTVGIILFGRRFTLLALMGVICMHFGIFMSSGIFFWKWMVLDAAMIWFLWRGRDTLDVQTVYQLPFRIISVLLIVYGGITLFDANRLAWHNGPVSNYFAFEVTDTAGQTYEFPHVYMQPYDFSLSQSEEKYLVDGKTLSNVYGSSSDYKSNLLLLSADVSEVDGIYDKYGSNAFSERDSRQFGRFLQIYFSNYNKHLGETFLPSILRPPLHMYTIPRANAYNNQLAISKIAVHYYAYFFNGEDIVPVKDQVVLEVDIPQN